MSPDAVLLGLYARTSVPDAQVAVRSMCAQLDWSWLAPGDSVFIKLACNSGNFHPAVTSPNAVRAVVGELLDRGAGRILVGDQGGIAAVETRSDGTRRGSTHALTERNGLHQAIVESGAEPYYFDDQAKLNPEREGRPAVERFGYTYRVGDRVLQTENNYGKDVFNGDLGVVKGVDVEESEVRVEFDGRSVTYEFGELDELVPAYAMTIHKSQGSEFPAVVIPVHTQHYVMLQRNLLYTGITRGRKLVVLVGTHRAVGIAVQKGDAQRRHSGLRGRLAGRV